jgi:hypothetical protein
MSRSLLGAKNLLARYQTIADGTAITAPVDPLPSSLTELQIDLQDALANFQADLIVIHEEGSRQIKRKPASDTSTSLAKSNQEEPSVSILPVAGARVEFVGRAREEVLQAMDRAGEEITVTSSSGKQFPSKNGFLKNVDGLGNEADGLYGRAAEKVHEAVRAAGRVLAATPSPETFSETVDSVAAKASSAVFSINENVRTGAADAYADAYAQASSAIHSTAQNAANPASVQVETEDAGYLESIAEEVMAKVQATVIKPVSSAMSSVRAAASSASHSNIVEEATSSAASTAPDLVNEARSLEFTVGATPSPEKLTESASSLQRRASSLAKASAAASDAYSSAYTAAAGIKHEEL